MKLTMLVEFDLSLPKYVEHMMDREKAEAIIELCQTSPEIIREAIRGQYVTVKTGLYKNRIVGMILEETIQ